MNYNYQDEKYESERVRGRENRIEFLNFHFNVEMKQNELQLHVC